MLKELDAQIRSKIEAAQGTYGVAIHHFETGETFAHQQEERFNAASIIKMPVMAAIYDQAFHGKLSLGEELVMRAEDVVGGSGVLSALSPNLKLSIYDMVVLMIIESDNTATNLLIDRIGMDTVQRLMGDWGMMNSRIINRLRIIPANVEGTNEITALDVNHFLIQLGQGKIVSWHACIEMVKIMKQQLFKDGIPSLLPAVQADPVGALPSWQFAHKTGFVNGVEHDAGLLYFANASFAITILTKNLTDKHAAKRVQGEIGRLLFDAAAKL